MKLQKPFCSDKYICPKCGFYTKAMFGIFLNFIVAKFFFSLKAFCAYCTNFLKNIFMPLFSKNRLYMLFVYNILANHYRTRFYFSISYELFLLYKRPEPSHDKILLVTLKQYLLYKSFCHFIK